MNDSRPNVWIATKTFPFVECIYRYWRATDGSRYLRSYNFRTKVILECRQLDNQRMTIPRGDALFSEIDLMLSSVFRHKIIVAEDDPLLTQFKLMSDSDLCRIMILPDVGLEKIAEGIYNHIKVILSNQDVINRIDVRSVEVDDGEINISYVV